MQAPVTACLVLKETHTKPTEVADVNVKSTANVPQLWLVSDSNVSIHALVLVALEPRVPSSITYPLVHAFQDTKGTRSSAADQFL